jgi:SIT4-associating protein SAP185/190
LRAHGRVASLQQHVKKRDAEREKLKAEGRLASATHEPNSADEFGRSVDSSGFHHAEAFSPLGESPEKIKNFDMQMQNNSNDEDGFEKVALDDADPDFEESNKHDYPEHEEAGMLSEKIDDMNLNEEISQNTDAASSMSSSLSIRRLGRKLSYILINKLGHNSATGALAADSATPAPLFARRNTSEQTSDAPSPFTQANINLGIKTDEPSNEDSQVGPDDEPGPEIQTEDDGTPVLGDLLKMQFTEHHVVPTILVSLITRCPETYLHKRAGLLLPVPVEQFLTQCCV